MAAAKNNTVKYIDLISKNAKDKEQEQLVFRAEEAELEVKQAILETKKEIAKAKRELEDAKCAVPYSLQAEIDATVTLENLEKGLSIAETVAKERF